MNEWAGAAGVEVIGFDDGVSVGVGMAASNEGWRNGDAAATEWVGRDDEGVKDNTRVSSETTMNSGEGL